MDNSMILSASRKLSSRYHRASSNQKLSIFFKKEVYTPANDLYDHYDERINHILIAMLKLHHLQEP